MIDFYIALYSFQFFFWRRCFRLFFQKCKNPGGAGKRVLKLSDNAADIIKGLHVLVGIGQHNRKSSYSQRTHRDQKSSGKSHSCINDIIDKACGGIGKTAVKDSLLTCLLQFFVDSCKTLEALSSYPKA